MRIKQATLHPYRLALRNPWKTSHGRLSYCDGCLLAVQGEGGQTGWGDYSPLAPRHSQTYQSGLRQLSDTAANLPFQSLDVARQSVVLASLPALAALECALLDLEARSTGSSLVASLGTPIQTRIAVNLAGGALGAQAHLHARDAVVRGFATIKFKVGLACPQLEALHLRQIHQLCPTLNFRLDANGAWEMEQARAFINETLDLPIEMLEEPLRLPSAEGLNCLQTLSPYPLALDESLRGQIPGQSSAQWAVRRLVLKPTLLGGPSLTLRWIAFARSRGLEPVLTSALESAVGISMVAHLAALLPELPCHGLATSEWIRDDVAPLPSVQSGYLPLPAGDGLGVNPTVEGIQHV